MRKIMYFILICNILFFSVCIYVEYSEKNYTAIHDRRTAIEIRKPENIDANAMASKIVNISEKTGIDLYYEKIEAALTGHPKYIIYKTNVSPDFFDLHIDRKKNTILEKYEIFTTLSPIETNQFRIIGSSLLYDLEIHSMESFDCTGFNKGVFYVNDKDARDLAGALVTEGIATSLIQNSSYNIVIPEWKSNQAVLLVMLVISMLFYFFTKKREFVIKKILGYSNLTILIEELKKILLLALVVIIFATMGFLVFLIVSNISATADCIYYIIPRFAAVFLLTAVLASITGLYIFTQSHAEDITGKTKFREIAIVSFVMKGIVLLFCILQAAGLVVSVQRYSSLKHTVDNNSDKLSGKYYVPFSAIGTDIDGNISEYLEKSKSLFYDIFNTFGDENVLVIDAGEYDGINDKFSSFVLINNRYLSINPINDERGEIIDANCFDRTVEHIFIPAYVDIIDFNKIYEFIGQMEELGNKVELHYYDANSSLFTFRAESGDKNGNIYNAILYMPSESNMAEYAIDLMSGYNLMILSPEENPYEKLYPLLVKNGLNDVIVECVEIADYYKSNLAKMATSAVLATYMIVLMGIIFIVSILFYAAVYFQNNKKRIAVKIMNGYGLEIYTAYWIQSTMLLICCLLLEWLISGTFLYGFIAAIIDAAIFFTVLIKQSCKNIATIMKGEN